MTLCMTIPKRPSSLVARIISFWCVCDDFLRPFGFVISHIGAYVVDLSLRVTFYGGEEPGSVCFGSQLGEAGVRVCRGWAVRGCASVQWSPLIDGSNSELVFTCPCLHMGVVDRSIVIAFILAWYGRQR